MLGKMKLLAGNSNAPLAEAIAAYLGEPLTGCHVRRFADLEIFVEILENVRGRDAFIIQSTSYPANDNLMELLIMIDALRRASAHRITAVIPYFGYARQDRKPGPRSPISAKLVANLITRAGADRVLTVDLHAGQIQGFFDIPTDNLFAAPTMVRDIQSRGDGGKNVMVVSPDVGGVVRARALAKRLDAPLAIVDKRRERAGESEVMNIIGDVKGRNCVLLDDIVDSGGTLCNAADALLAAGAESVSAYITHGVLSGGAVARVAASKLSELVLDRHDRADRGGAGRAQHPRHLDRAADRRGDRAHRQGRERLVAVQLTRARRARPAARNPRETPRLVLPSAKCARIVFRRVDGERSNSRACGVDRAGAGGRCLDRSVRFLDGSGARRTSALASSGRLRMFGRKSMSHDDGARRRALRLRRGVRGRRQAGRRL